VGKKRTIGEVAAGAARITGNGEDEETGIRTNATRKRKTITR
jgi:hypothetical protein